MTAITCTKLNGPFVSFIKMCTNDIKTKPFKQSVQYVPQKSDTTKGSYFDFILSSKIAFKTFSPLWCSFLGNQPSAQWASNNHDS